MTQGLAEGEGHAEGDTLEETEADTNIWGPPGKSNRLKLSEGRGSASSVTINPFLPSMGKIRVGSFLQKPSHQLFIVPCLAQVLLAHHLPQTFAST